MARQSEFVVSGQERLLQAAIAAFVREAHPEATVRTDIAPSPDFAGVRVLLSDTGRWLHIAPGEGPDTGSVQALADGAAIVVSMETSEPEFREALDGLARAPADDLPSRTLRWMAERTVSLLRVGGAGRQGEQSPLTGRERTVLRLLAEGRSTTEVAAALKISTHTVRAHVRSLSMKLEASGRARLLAAARAQGFPEAFATSAGRAAGQA